MPAAAAAAAAAVPAQRTPKANLKRYRGPPVEIFRALCRPGVGGMRHKHKKSTTTLIRIQGGPEGAILLD